MKILLFGRNGQLGSEFQRLLPQLGDVICLDRENLDLCDLNTLQKTLYKIKPNLVINSSAYTNVDLAEIQKDEAMMINALAPGIMAEWSRKFHAVFIHYSTDYVFDGNKSLPYTENDTTKPLGIYGKSKLMGEKNIEQAGGAYLILRTSWVYNLHGNNFVTKVLNWARKKENLKIVSDQISNPTRARDLASITTQVLAQDPSNFLGRFQEMHGVYHLAGSGYTSRYEWARQILASDPNRTEQLTSSIEPVASNEFPTTATRPLFSALDCSKFERTFNLRMPNWKISLHEAMTG